MKTFNGINIQWPISESILSGEKTIETRTYKISDKYKGEEILLIETPGKKGKFKARPRAIIVITDCYEYKSKKEFYQDSEKHLVTPDSLWAWKDKAKWGWKVKVIKLLKPSDSYSLPHGIVYRNGITIDI